MKVANYGLFVDEKANWLTRFECWLQFPEPVTLSESVRTCTRYGTIQRVPATRYCTRYNDLHIRVSWTYYDNFNRIHRSDNFHTCYVTVVDRVSFVTPCDVCFSLFWYSTLKPLFWYPMGIKSTKQSRLYQLGIPTIDLPESENQIQRQC